MKSREQMIQNIVWTLQFCSDKALRTIYHFALHVVGGRREGER